MKASTMKIIALILALAAVLSAASCSIPGTDTEETTTEAPIVNATATPSNTEAIVAYVNRLLTEAKTAKPALKYESNFGAGGFECNNETLKSALPTLAKEMLDGKKLEKEVAYGESFDDLMPIRGNSAAFQLNADDVISAVCIDPPEGRDVYRRVYIALKSETNPLPEGSFYGMLFSIPARDTIKAEFDKSLDYLTYNGYTANYKEGFITPQVDESGAEVTNKDSGNKEYDMGGCKLYVEINRETDEITVLEINGEVEISAKTAGVGTLAKLGEVDLSFVLNCTDKYVFNWAEPETAISEEG